MVEDVQFQSASLFPNADNLVYNIILWNKTESLGLVVSHVTVITHSMHAKINVKQLMMTRISDNVRDPYIYHPKFR